MERDRETRSRGEASSENAVSEKASRAETKTKNNDAKVKTLNIAELKEMNISTLAKVAKDLNVTGFQVDFLGTLPQRGIKQRFILRFISTAGK